MRNAKAGADTAHSIPDRPARAPSAKTDPVNGSMSEGGGEEKRNLPEVLNKEPAGTKTLANESASGNADQPKPTANPLTAPIPIPEKSITNTCEQYEQAEKPNTSKLERTPQTPSEAARARSNATATALVSQVHGAEPQLTCEVLLAGKVLTAHLDSCATHCFVSSDTSEKLTNRGYPPTNSPITFEVTQGRPLCDTDRVHYLPLSIVREDGRVSTWDECLFLVADAGAPVIICNTVLKLGGIVSYDPPAGYVNLLSQLAQRQPPLSQYATDRSAPADHLQTTTYQAPSRTSSRCLLTALNDDPPKATHTLGIDSKLLNPESCPSPLTKNDDGLTPRTEHSPGKNYPPRSELLSPGKHPYSAPAAKDDSTKPTAKKRKGETTMLSEEDPYGKNPPLPEEVLEAIKHLKLLSDPSTTPAYTPAQTEEIRNRLAEQRPKWARCLTLQQTIDVADKDTEKFIYDLMDKPKYQTSIFSNCMKKCCDLREFEINQLPGRDNWTPPQPRRFKNPNMSLIADAWLDALLDNEKCRESNASHPAPITVVEKDARDARVCVDYRNRNARSDVPVFPMPDVHDFLDENEGFKYYCSFDMAKMFTQFRIKEEHKHLAAFITPRGVFEPNCVMFGLKGGPQHAVRECGGAMATDPLTNGKDFTKWALEQNKLGVTPPYELCPSKGVIKGSRLRPFIDDVTIPSNHTEGMKKLVELFLEFCYKHHLILSLKKAKIMKTHLRMLGFVVSEDGKHLDPHRIITLLEAKKPQSKETLHSLLSSYTFVRMFIPNFASIAAPLHEATRGIIWKGPQSGKSKGIREVDPDFIWTPEMTRAYEQLRNALLEAPILVKVDWRFPLFLSVDASLRGEGWVLWQLITTTNGTKVAVAILYGSRKYTDTERNWETTRQEVSAIRSALNDVEDYVFGQHFYVFSDHLNLRFMHNSINRAVLRLRDYLSQFDMTVIHCPGIWNNADSISRLENENLPVELAQELNSATSARLEGTLISYSIGTNTEEDPFTKGDNHLQPKVICIPKDAGVTNVKVLCTTTSSSYQTMSEHPECSVHCLLCNVNRIPISLETEEVQVKTPGICLSTTVDATTLLSDEMFESWDTLIQHIFHTPGPFTSTLRAEAGAWNERSHKAPRLGMPSYSLENEVQDPEQESDLEDLRWCGPIDRNAVVLRSVASHQFEPRALSSRLTPTNSQKTKTNKQVRFQLDDGATIIEDTHPEATTPTPESNPSSVQAESLPPTERLKELVDFGTQTCPADFRIATIRFPMIDDFKAIHGHESGHHGVDYSYRKLIKRCGSKWANERGEATKVKAALKSFIDACPICQKVRGLHEKVKAKHSFIVSRPFLEVSYDFIILKEDKNGNRNLLVAICNFLKIVEIRASPHRDAETVARFLLELGSRYGHMARLRSDKDGAFTAHLIKKLNHARKTEEVQCVPYHPQANSICERQNGLIMSHLNALVLECKLGPESEIAWSDLVPEVFALVNTTPKNPLGISPLSMLYGVFANYDQPLLPTNEANKPGSVSNPLDYVDSLMAWQNKLLEVTEQIQSDHFEKLDKKLNVENDRREFHVGDFVLQHKRGTSLSGKPNPRWLGPFLVMDRRNNDPSHPVLDLMNLTDMKVKEASVEDCRIFNTSWFEEENLLPELIKIAATDQNEYVVERIVSHKPIGEKRTIPLSKYLFEVKWQDFEDTTWEPYSGLKHLEPMEEYSKNHPALKLNDKK